MEQELFSELSKNLPAIITALTAILSALLASLGTYFINRTQFRIKIAELRGQSELKAKEHLFNSYQQRIERLVKDYSEFSDKIWTNVGSLLTFEDDERDDVLKKVFWAVRKMLKYNEGFIDEIEKELQKEQLFDQKWDQKLQYIRNICAKIDSDNPDPMVKADILFIISKVQGIISDAQFDLLDKKSKELFSAFVKERD